MGKRKNMSSVKIHPSWHEALRNEFEKPYFLEIKKTLLSEKAAGKTIYPPGSLIFHAFDSTPLDEVKVVILGQDPYHQPGQAHGLSFSVPHGVNPPPSLKNIYKELEASIEGFKKPAHGCLEKWSQQGVLLLNSILTVRANEAASHSKIGWNLFTDAAIQAVSKHREGVVFMLWGGFAKQKAALIDERKHHVLTAAHPSPLAGNAFQGCGHFKKANEILGLGAIDWSL